jgi:YD repeat-containing protein
MSSAGNAAELTFDTNNRMTQSLSTDPLSKAYTYDDLGRISSSTENGVRTDYTRDTHGNITLAKSGDPTQSYQAAYDERGRMIKGESGTGSKISKEYDSAGNTIAFTTGQSGRFERELDAAGRVTTERFPSGLSLNYERDARGIVTKKSDNKGHFVSIERDAGGAVTGFVTANGSWLRATHDQAGRIVGLKTSEGKGRTYAYDGRGALTEFTNARGQHKKLRYDGSGRIQSIDDDGGNKMTIDRDRTGHIQLISSFNSSGSRHDYDAKGQLLAANAARSRVQFIKAVYSVSSVEVGSPDEFDCVFGLDGFFGDGFWSDSGAGPGFGYDPFNTFGSGCGLGFGGGGCDPFAGFDPFGSGFGFDPFACNSFFGETRQQCIARHMAACDLQFYACLGLTVTGGITVFATCDIATLILGTPACAVLTGVVGVVGAAACVLHGTACNWNAQDGCPDS